MGPLAGQLPVRGQKVMLDSDLAALYGVSTARLNQQVRGNIERFPPDFMFTLDMEEHARLMLQIATSNTGRGGRRKSPLATVFAAIRELQAPPRKPERRIGLQP